MEKVLIVKQILLISTIGNVWRTVWRICKLISGFKGLASPLMKADINYQMLHLLRLYIFGRLVLGQIFSSLYQIICETLITLFCVQRCLFNSSLLNCR